MTTEHELEEGRRNLREEMAPTGIGPSGFIPSSEGEFESATHAEPKARSQWALFRRRFLRHRVAIFSIFVLLFLVIVCFGANCFAPFKNTDQDLLLGPVSHRTARTGSAPTSSAGTSSAGSSTPARSR